MILKLADYNKMFKKSTLMIKKNFKKKQCDIILTNKIKQNKITIRIITLNQIKRLEKND
jgi:hypothetical protein